MRWILSIILLVFSTYTIISQNEAQKWYFGNHCGLDFATNPPVPIASPVFSTNEGGASICDPSGNLLFYTDANTVWDQSHSIMANGTGLLGNLSSTQSALIVRQPGSSTLYYIFTLEEGALPNGLRYSIVDMSLAAGAGSVTVKNIPLYTPSCEKICGVHHCNGRDIWVITHDYNSNVFRNYLVTSTGLNTTPVLAAIGPVTATFGYIGQMKVSSTGKKIALTNFNNGITLFDFDAASGIVSNPFALVDYLAYGCEFSPDGSKFYAGDVNLFQWDLCAGSNSAIQSSSVTLASNIFGSYQLAPDRKIYITSSAGLSVIHNPDQSGAASNFVYTGQSVGTGTTSFGLPSFVASYFKPAVTFSLTQNCSVASFTAPAVNASCNASQTFTSTSWIFSDPASGALNTSTLSTVTHTFFTPGIYTIKLLLHTACGADTVSKTINVLATPLFTSASSVTICAGSSATLQATGADSYSWTSGESTSSLVVSPGSTTTYTVAGSYTNGCGTSSLAIITLSVFPLPTLSVSGQFTICSGETITLTASGATSYTWSTGTLSAGISTSPTVTTSYTISGVNAGGCSSSRSVQVQVITVPPLSVNALTLCSGSSGLLSATTTPANGLTYLWQPGGSTTSSINVSPSTTTEYTVTTFLTGCKRSVSSLVIVTPTLSPLTEFSYETPVCIHANDPDPYYDIHFHTGGAFSSQDSLSIDPNTGRIDLSQSSPGTYIVTYSYPEKNCISAGSYTAPITIGMPPDLKINGVLKVGPGESTILTASGASLYTWDRTPDMSCGDCAETTVAPQQTTRYCVETTDGGCKVRTCVVVEVSCNGGDFSLPNAFSPNGDGRNDLFCLQGWSLCNEGFSVLIFNRWGEKVFESDNPSFCWDGIYKGQYLESDVFTFAISATFKNGTRIDKKGNIALLR